MSQDLRCARCDHRYPPTAWRCIHCRGVLDLAAGVDPQVAALAAELSLGERCTPLVRAPRQGVAFKIDYLMPTGSFKDRGAVLVVATARWLGLPRLVVDSSGNAGAAIAAYAARAGLGCSVFLPAGTSPGKIKQLRAYRAEVREVPGPRQDAADAAGVAADEPGVFYASHVYQPAFLHGTKSYALELAEQLDGRLPTTLVLPVGNGTLVLGAYLALGELAAQGHPGARIVAVQAAACAPLAEAFAAGAAEPRRVVPSPTVAEGIAIARPARGEQILAAVRDTGGDIVTVTDEQVLGAQADLAGRGLYVEPTAAVCWAAVRAGLVPPEGAAGDGVHTVLPLCGSGLKSG